MRASGPIRDYPIVSLYARAYARTQRSVARTPRYSASAIASAETSKANRTFDRVGRLCAAYSRDYTDALNRFYVPTTLCGTTRWRSWIMIKHARISFAVTQRAKSNSDAIFVQAKRMRVNGSFSLVGVH